MDLPQSSWDLVAIIPHAADAFSRSGEGIDRCYAPIGAMFGGGRCDGGSDNPSA
jgi:hypothetical protein